MDKDLTFQKETSLNLLNQKPLSRSHPSNSNDHCKSYHSTKNTQTDRVSSKPLPADTNFDGNTEGHDIALAKVEQGISNTKKVYRGLLFIEGLHNVKDQPKTEYFITYEGFWDDCHESTEMSVDFVFNYLKVEPNYCLLIFSVFNLI